ncbi:MAG TPA: histidine--tRNA ligase [Euryarchaeota archaeon]|nr:histidine--tRNA ligase [Euryarchaeota archaeon]
MFQRPRGTRDFGPEEMTRRRWAESQMRNTAIGFGFREIQLPTFEGLDLFTTKSGQGIVDELYAFEDKGGRMMALRPEMTAQVMRFYIAEMSVQPKPLKLFYFGPCFRYENPQSGRFREFFQLGAEIIGSRTPETDAEVISLAVSTIESTGLKNCRLRIGYIGVLRSMLANAGILDSKISEGLHLLDKNDEKGFSAFASEAGISEEKVAEMLSLRGIGGGEEVLDRVPSDDAKKYLQELSGMMKKIGIRGFEFDLGIVRGLDYYSGMVFEIDAPNLGAEKQVCGGGSYSLIPAFGGEEVFTTGFALGFDRVLIALEKEEFEIQSPGLDAFIIPLGEEARESCMELVSRLRKSGFIVDFDLMRRNLSKNLKYASSAGAKTAIILGTKELSSGTATIRDMVTGDQKEVPLDSIRDFLGSNP